MKLLSLIPKLTKHVTQYEIEGRLIPFDGNMHVRSEKNNESTSLVIDNMCL